MARTFQLIVLTPVGLDDPSLAIAASRAGELGVLDLEYHAGVARAVAAVERLDARAHVPFGVKLDPADNGLIDALLAAPPELLGVALLASGPAKAMRAALKKLRAGGLTVLVEATSLEAARAAVRAGADGVIAKGHEAGGSVGDESAYVLLQRLLSNLKAPVYAQGGIGLHTAAACYAAGAAGVVLDSQLALTRESALPEAVKEKIAMMDGSETAVYGMRLGASYRFYTRPGLPALERLRRLELQLENEAVAPARTGAWQEAVRQAIGWGAPDRMVYALGQDACLAASLAARYITVAGVLQALRAAIPAHCAVASALRPLGEHSPLAQAHGTRYPIAQGPMTRVSDTAAFAVAVAEGGALPFLALSLLRGPEVHTLLDEARMLLGERSWGVGILGFVSPDLREEQVAVIREMRPPWALIAGGRPAQAHSLEQEGIATYLHVPSPGLLKMFLQDGAHRFVFEGRECGGHVGPRTSFVLWETMIEALVEARRAPGDPPIDVLFAGGIHDALSAAMVAALAAPLAERGMRVGVLMGTAYLFTEEAVSSGTIVSGFQQEALTCAHTVLLESGPGHSTRCADTDFYGVFEAERRRLHSLSNDTEEIRGELEDLNVGRLRIASKGIDRHPRYGQDPDAPKFIALSEQQQRAEGMYMIGQVAALRDSVTTIAALHHNVSVEGTELLERVAIESDGVAEAVEAPAPADVAIVGIAALLPQAPDAQTYWENILNKVNVIGEVPPDRWDWRRYFDEDKTARDRVYSRWGGFLQDVPFDPISYGMPPNTMRSVEPMQLLTLEAVRAALEDAGYVKRPFSRERTAVILGASGVSDLGLLYGVRSTLPTYLDGEENGLVPALADALPEWTEDSFPGVLMNVTSGRVTNRFDFGGTNFTIDAACASSLAAVAQGLKELQLGTADMVVAGGADTAQNAHAFMAFSKTHALSPRGRCRPFDATADGIAISEGVAIVILKRLADAERDGDRIYAIIKGVGSSSDGRDKSLTAPRPEGQMRALERAYRQAGFSPATVGLIEAHGTGTVVGDKTEVASLSAVFEAAGAAPGSCAIGSVKSMIGHTKATAGVASLVKVACALYHRTLPPTLVEQPNLNAGFGENAFYVNSEARPWLDGVSGHPRRAGVSAFGFGGTNFHVALEEYTGGYLAAEAPARTWAGELLLFRAATREALRELVAQVVAGLDRGAQPRLLDLAYSLARMADGAGAEALSLAIVAASLDDLRPKLATALEALAGDAERLSDPRGVYFTAQPLAREGRIAFLFPGQGSQYVDMLRDLAIQFPEVQCAFEQAGATLLERFPTGLGPFVYPPPVFGKEETERQQARLTATNVAQPALGACDVAMLSVLASLGLAPEMVAGHSYGEFVALYAAGVIDLETLFVLSEARGRFMAESAGEVDPGMMAAAVADAATVAALIEGIEGVVLANLNAPVQTVISGTTAGVTAAIERLKEQGIRARTLPVSCAFHSPLVAGARDRLLEVMAGVRFNAPRLAVYANMTATPYPHDPAEIAALLGDHLVSPVRFVDEVEAMYEAGARIFVETGPRNVLANLADSILGERPHLSVATDQAGRPGLLQLQHALAQLAAQGVPIYLERLYQGRGARRLDVRAMDERTGRVTLPPTTWLVNGGYARPISEERKPLIPVALAIGRDDPTTSGRPTTEGMTASTGTASDAGGDMEGLMTQMQQDVGANLAPATPNGSHAPAPPNGHAPNPVPAPMYDARAAYGHAPQPAMPAPMPYPDEVSVTVMQFQQVMAQFLETQRAIMAAYFGHASGLPATPPLGYQPAAYLPPTPRPSAIAPPVAYVPPAAQPAYVPAPQPVYAPAAPLAQPQPVATPPGLSSAAAPTLAPTPAPVATPAPAPVATPAPAPVAAMPAPAPAPVEQPKPEPVAPAAPAPEATPAMDEAEVTRRLLAIVSERTGYPSEMLGLDLDLEADLGIDSIKRVEIVGSLRRSVATGGIKDDAMEKLSSVKTLRAVVTGMMAAIAPSVPAHPPPASLAATVAAPDAPHTPVASVPRFTLRATTAPSISEHGFVSTEGTVVVTDDERGLAQSLAATLRERGHRVAILRAASKTERLGPETFAADVAAPAAVDEALAMIRQEMGAVGSVIHLLPLRDAPAFEAMDLAAWKRRLALEVKSLYYLTHAAGPELCALGEEKGGAVLLAAIGMGGAFGIGSGLPSSFFPGHGGIPGFLKTLGLEWPQVRVKAVDLDASAPAPELLEHLLTELTAGDEEIEIGWQGNQRVMLESVRAPLETTAPATLELDSSSVILVTGGARGITAGLAHEIARRCRPTLLLVGRSALPSPDEPADTAGLSGARELKAALIARMQAAGQKVTLAQVEAAYTRLLQDREIRATMAGLTETGATIRYYAVDVRDEAAFGGLIDEIYATYGRLDGVIHGAGVIEDKLVLDKTPESYDRVFDTKVDSAFVLARTLRPDSLKFLAFFSSVTARFGNRGQADYGATNDVINKLALELDARWPARVISYNWGPWASGGMVSAEVEAQFARRGVELIRPEIGWQRAADEVWFGRKGEVEIVYGDGPWGQGLRRMRYD